MVRVESASNPVLFGQTWQVKDGPPLFSSLPGSATSACSRIEGKRTFWSYDETLSVFLPCCLYIFLS
jgi:hypothetical protein